MDLLDQMRTFMKIVETGGLGAAARSRTMSVAAVSRQLTALEADLHATLVARSTRQLAITESGRRWYEACTRMLQELDTARADVAEDTDVRGTVVVSAPISYGLGHIVERLARLSQQHPQLSVELRLEDHAIDLLGNGVDIAVRIGMTLPDSTSVIAHKLVTFRRAALASTAYLRRHGTPKHPADLADHAILAHQRAAPIFTRWRFTKAAETIEIPVRARLSSTSPVVLRDWARSGMGIALIPEWLDEGLRRVLPDWQTPAITASALHRAEVRGAARIRAVVAALAAGMTDTA